MIVLGLDFETTFTDPIQPKEARIVEIGAALYCTETNQIITTMSELVWGDDYPAFDPRITQLTGIAEGMLRFALTPQAALTKLKEMIDKCDAIVAHNGKGFDEIVLECELARAAMEYTKKLMIDTSSDVPYPKQITTRKLVHLCAEHGFVNPFPHRAIFDVMSMLKVLSRYPAHECYERALAPDVRVIADVKKPWDDGGKSSELAKARGYRFDGLTKTWGKIIKEFEVAAEVAEAPFNVFTPAAGPL